MVPPGRPGASTSQRILTYLLRSSLIASQLALVLAAALGLLIAGPLGALNAAVGSAVVIVFFASGQGIQLIAGELGGSNGLLLTLTSYLVRVGLLGLGLWLVGHSDSLSAVLRPDALVLGLVLTLVAWLAGMFVGHARVRKPVYDSVDLDSADLDQGLAGDAVPRGERA